MTWTQTTRRVLTSYAVAILIAGWVVLTLIVAASIYVDGPIQVDATHFGEHTLEIVLLYAAGPSIGWTLHASLQNP